MEATATKRKPKMFAVLTEELKSETEPGTTRTFIIEADTMSDLKKKLENPNTEIIGIFRGRRFTPLAKRQLALTLM